MTEEAPRHVFLVDGSGYIFRAFHALPPMTRPDGTPVNAVYGFTAMLMRLVEDTDADRIAVVFDVARTTFRNDIYPDYKANRDDPPPELVPQFALIRDAVKALNLQVAELPGYEADDIIATYARRAAALGAEVTIVSSDKDLMQLVDERISLFDPVKQRRIGGPEVVERFGVPPEKVVDVQALAGDSSDNVPGVPGIGVKTAAQLIGEYGDLDTLLARAEEIRQPKRRSQPPRIRRTGAGVAANWCCCATMRRRSRILMPSPCRAWTRRGSGHSWKNRASPRLSPASAARTRRSGRRPRWKPNMNLSLKKRR